MGWNSANEIVDPIVETLVNGVANNEMDEAVAEQLLYTLIKKCQDGDWDTEYETLEQYLHVPWVVRTFARCDVTPGGGDGLPDRTTLVSVIDRVLTSGAQQYHDLTDAPKGWHAGRIADAVLAFAEET